MVTVVLPIMVAMPVRITDANSDAADPDLDAFRDDHWFVAGAQGTGQCRRRQKRNKKKGEHRLSS